MLKITYLLLIGILFSDISNLPFDQKDTYKEVRVGTDEDYFCCAVNIALFGIFGNLCLDDYVEFGFKLGSPTCQVLDVLWDDSDGSTVISERNIANGLALRVGVPFTCELGVYHIEIAGSVLVKVGSCVQWVPFSKSFNFGGCCSVVLLNQPCFCVGYPFR